MTVKEKHLNKITAILLSIMIAFAFTLTGCGEEEPIGAKKTKNVAGIEYYHYDPADFNSMCDDDLVILCIGCDREKTYHKEY